MTLQNMVETIQTVFPNLGEAQIIHEINNALEEFSKKTFSVTGLYKLANIDQNVSWALPSNVLQVDKVDAFDSDGKRVYLGNYDIIWEVSNGYITFYYSYEDGDLESIPDGISELYLWTFDKATASTTTTELSIDSAYHEGIEARVLSKAYSLYPVTIATQNGPGKMIDWNAVRHYESVFREAVKEAIRTRNSGQKSGYEILMHDYAGSQDVVLPDKTGAYSSATEIT